MMMPNIQNAIPLYSEAEAAIVVFNNSLIISINESIKKNRPMMKLNSLNLLYITFRLKENNI